MKRYRSYEVSVCVLGRVEVRTLWRAGLRPWLSSLNLHVPSVVILVYCASQRRVRPRTHSYQAYLPRRVSISTYASKQVLLRTTMERGVKRRGRKRPLREHRIARTPRIGLQADVSQPRIKDVKAAADQCREPSLKNEGIMRRRR